MTKSIDKGKSPATITCGLVMPISPIDSCSSEHWDEVKNIVSEAIKSIDDPVFTIKLVSDADDSGVIQKRIVQNIFNSDIIVCDVSGKNPNVMFELGMRLAFDKPTIIIKDDKTDYSFDTGIIEHVPYPRDLRYTRVVTFKSALADKVLATHRAALKDPDHSTFLKNFGKFQVASLIESVIPADKLVIEMLSELQTEVSNLRRSLPRNVTRINRNTYVPDDDLYEKIAFALNVYRNNHPDVSLKDLIGNQDLYHEIDRRIEAPRYFSSSEHFNKGINNIIEQMAKKSI